LISDISSGIEPIDAITRRLEKNNLDEGYSSIEVPEKQSAAEESPITSEPEVEAAEVATPEDTAESIPEDEKDEKKWEITTKSVPLGC